MPTWSPAQFRSVFSDFRDECPPDAWDDLLISYGILLEKGPASGPSVAKKLVNAKGIWELIGHADGNQPRVLFYFDSKRIVFVHAILKKGKQDYPPAIKLAQQRRKSFERGEKEPNAIEELKPHYKH